MKLVKSKVEFDEERHLYTLNGKELQGVTSTLIRRAFPRMYERPARYDEEQWSAILANAAKRGTAMHNEVQGFFENNKPLVSQETLHWVDLCLGHSIEWIENEYLVTDGKRYASKADIIAMVDGELSIIDMKFTSEIHRDATSLQTSIYKMWFEQMNKGMKVKNLYIYWAHGDKWSFEKLPVVDERTIKKLMTADIHDDSTYVYYDTPSWFVSKEQKRLMGLLQKKKSLEAEIEKVKTLLMDNMTKNNYSSFVTPFFKVNYIAPTTATTFDAARFKAEHPEMYGEYLKTQERKSTIKIS